MYFFIDAQTSEALSNPKGPIHSFEPEATQLSAVCELHFIRGILGLVDTLETILGGLGDCLVSNHSHRLLVSLGQLALRSFISPFLHFKDFLLLGINQRLQVIGCLACALGLRAALGKHDQFHGFSVASADPRLQLLRVSLAERQRARGVAAAAVTPLAKQRSHTSATFRRSFRLGEALRLAVGLENGEPGQVVVREGHLRADLGKLHRHLEKLTELLHSTHRCIAGLYLRS